MDELAPLIIDGLPIFEVAYTHEPEKFFVREGDRYRVYAEKNVIRRLQRDGISKIAQGGALTAVEDALIRIQEERSVDFAGPLAGWPAGLLKIAGKEILVTEPTIPLEAKDVPWPNLEKFLNDLFGPEPLRHHYGWWQWGRKNLLGDKIMPGQVPCYIGKSGIGKSYLQKLTTILLGDKPGDPWQSMVGDTGFNADVFFATHLVLEDRASDPAIKSRRMFGQAIKELSVNHVQRCHDKFKRAIVLWPKWRISISINDEVETLKLLPPLDDSILDKMMLFQCSMPDWPVDMKTDEGWQEWDRIVAEELPGLAYHIDHYDIGDLAINRYGVKPWHDSRIMDREEESSPESILLECIRHDLAIPVKEKGDKTKWEGKATDLERLLLGRHMNSYDQTRKVLSWPGACGTYLGRLAKKHKGCITSKRYTDGTRWTIDLEKL